MLSHVLGQHTQTDGREIVDREASALGVVLGEETLPVVLQAWLLESLSELFESELLLQLLEQDLDKDSRAASGIFLVHVHDGQRRPADAIGREKVAKEAGDVTKTIGFVSVDRVVIVGEALCERFGPLAMKLAEALAHVAIEFAISSLL